MPIVERAMIRLMADPEALGMHLQRLVEDGNVLACPYPGAHGSTPSSIIESGPLSGGYEQMAHHLMLLADPICLYGTAAMIRRNPLPFWVQQLAITRPPFVPGDRDDLVVGRLYQLVRRMTE
jgi:hypothetical protein